jgi:pyruvate,water dikinase
MSQKAKNLEILASAGIAVPQGFTLPPDHYQRAVSELAGAIDGAMPNAQNVQSVFATADLQANTKRFIDEHLARFPNVSRFAVRSSGSIASGEGSLAILEDSAEMSLAGQFDSFLNVPAEMVGHAVKRCWASLFNARSIASFQGLVDYVRMSAMTVVIQEMIPAKASAVMMTADPLGDGRTGTIEFTWGPCGAIVSGITSPDEAVFDRATGRLVSVRVGRKERRVVYSDYGDADDNESRLGTTIEEQRIMSIESPTIMRLIALGNRIERLFGRPQDIEAVVTESNGIVITQARPVTMLADGYVPFDVQMVA